MGHIEDKTNLILNWIDGKPQSPYMVEIAMGDGCNQNCKFCGDYNNQIFVNKMNDKRFYSIIKEAADLGTKMVMITGEGEPLFNKNKFLTIANLVKKYNMIGALDTNGTLFTESDIKSLVEIGWDFINVSLEGPDAETHDYLVERSGNFEKAIKNIKLFNEYKKILNNDKPEICILSVLNNKNYDKILEMIGLASDLDVGLNIMSLIVLHDTGKKLILSKEQELFLRRNLKKYIKYAKEKSINFNLYPEIISNVTFKRKSENKIKNYLYPKASGNKYLSASCYEPWIRILIDSMGCVSTCGRFHSKVTVANQKVKDVWFGSYFNKMRKNVLNNNLLKACNNCCELGETIQIRKDLVKKFR